MQPEVVSNGSSSKNGDEDGSFISLTREAVQVEEITDADNVAKTQSLRRPSSVLKRNQSKKLSEARRNSAGKCEDLASLVNRVEQCLRLRERCVELYVEADCLKNELEDFVEVLECPNLQDDW
ncbi:MAG: hypothetical protein MHPSP_003457, partial [Paramarteilia canceri]